MPCACCGRLGEIRQRLPHLRRKSSGPVIMVVGIGVITLRIHDCRSLKGKRKVVKSIVQQIRNAFNASVAEVGANDVYQRAEIGFALVGNDRQVMNSKIDKLFNLVEGIGTAEMVDTEMEIFNA